MSLKEGLVDVLVPGGSESAGKMTRIMTSSKQSVRLFTLCSWQRYSNGKSKQLELSPLSSLILNITRIHDIFHGWIPDKEPFMAHSFKRKVDRLWIGWESEESEESWLTTDLEVSS